MEKSRQYAHFSVTLRLLFKRVILSFVYCKILFFVWTRYMYVLLPVELLAFVGTEGSDRPGFMRKTCFSPFNPYLQLRQTLCSNIGNASVAKVLV